MRISPGKMVAGLIALTWCGVMIMQAGRVTPDVVKSALGLLVPLVLIWFPEQLGSFTGYVGRGGNIDTPTPGFLIAGIGWFMLLGVPVVIYFLA
jgi:hypothetical protein